MYILPLCEFLVYKNYLIFEHLFCGLGHFFLAFNATSVDSGLRMAGQCFCNLYGLYTMIGLNQLYIIINKVLVFIGLNQLYIIINKVLVFNRYLV